MLNEEMKLVPDLFGKDLEMRSIRDGHGQGLLELGEKNTDVVVVDADLRESLKVEDFFRKWPERAIEVGVAEQNMIGIGAGLSMVGKIPFVHSYAVFSPGRNWDQLRVSVCYTNANVKVVGGHTGLSVGSDGATHQALEDIALTRVLPHMTVLVPMDAEEARKAVFVAAEIYGPVYIRLNRPKVPVITTLETPFVVGKANILRYGEGVTIVSCGSMVYEALRAAEEVDGEVINMHTIKPLDVETLLGSVKKTKRVVVVEEHQVNGGLAGAVAEALMETYPVPMKRVGVWDTFGESGEQDELLEKYGLTWERIVEVVNSM